MADALFDTSVFIDYHRGDSGARELVEQIIAGTLTGAYSSISVFELWLGNMGQVEASTYENLLVLLEEAFFDGHVAQRAANMLQSVSTQDRQRLLGDAFIAATAAERGETIYTRNVRDFRSLNVNVSTY